MKYSLTLTLCVLLGACTEKKKDYSENFDANPFAKAWDTPYGVPDFQNIDLDDYIPAFKVGMERQLAEVQKIALNTDDPTFENTLGAFEQTGEVLNRVSYVFYNLNSSNTNDTLQKIAKEISPLLSAHRDALFMNALFFKRIQSLYNNREKMSLSEEENKLVENYYTKCVRAGAALDKKQKEQVKKINEELAKLSVQFGENLLKEVNKFELLLSTKEELVGLPKSVLTAAKETAQEKGYENMYLFTPHRPSLYPFITYSQNRELRKTLKKGYIMRGNNDDEWDNKAIIQKIVNLRLEKANILGYETHAHYALAERMLNTPEKVYNLLDKVWPPALAAAQNERMRMEKMASEEGQNHPIMPWDWWYYAEKIKKKDFDLDEEEIRTYLKVDNVIKGTFILAEKLFGLTFEERQDIPKYHHDVKTYLVKNDAGEEIGVYLSDWFYRSNKRGGAWMNSFRKQQMKKGKRINPIVVNVGNFTKPNAQKPSLLSQEEATTLFHEFGHALHGLLSECTYPSISGTATPRDFVEFPSQVLENWVFEPEMLKLYAFHYETGAVMPNNLVEKIKKANTFNQGFATVEYLAACYLDMAFHTLTEPLKRDVNDFEKKIMDEKGLIEAIVPRYRSTYFQHIFSGGYSAGYYSYLNSEVMDADAFSVFKMKGIFDKATADKYREHILSKGGTRDALEMYVNFRGQKPNYNGLLVRRGFN